MYFYVPSGNFLHTYSVSLFTVLQEEKSGDCLVLSSSSYSPTTGAWVQSFTEFSLILEVRAR